MKERIHIKQKIVLVGDPMVGKTSLIKRFVFDVFSNAYLRTAGMKISRKDLTYDKINNGQDIDLTLMIWDIMGQKGPGLFPKSPFKGAKGAIMVCDVTRKQTLMNLTNLTTALLNIEPNIPIIFVANKNDLTYQMTFDEKSLADFSTLLHAPYFFTSAKTGQNVEIAFTVMGRMVLSGLGY